MKRRCPLFGLMVINLTLLLSSCSSFNKMAIGASSGLVYSAGMDLETQSNYDIFKSGVPGNLVLIEGLLSQSSDNLELLATLNKGYAGYAFAINETEVLNEEWGEIKTEAAKKQALFNYTRALNFGLRYLKLKKIEISDLHSKMNDPQAIAHLLDKRLSDSQSDLELVLFTAQAYAALINLQKDNISLIADLPIAKGMFDWVCMKDPKIKYGMCDIFYGAYEAGRPKMLGGNPEKGKEIFLRAIENHPHNWLIRASYMQYYLIPQNDKIGFDQQLEYLMNKQDEFNHFSIFSNSQKTDDFSWSRESSMRLFQSLALARMELMNKYQKQFF